MSNGAQRCRHCHAAGGRARGPVRLRYVWYGMLLQLPLVLGFQAYRWRCSACKKMYTDYPAGVVAYSRHSVALMYEMMDYLRGSSIAEVSRRYHIAEQTASNMLLRAVRITPDWDSLRRERELHLVVDEHSCAGKELVITVCEARTTQIRRLGRSAGHGGLMAAGRKGNEAVAPPIIGMGIITEGRQPGGLERAGHKGSEAAAPPRLCR